ncbi:MAG: hypothetical protein ACLTOJ_21825 [[Clostridium] symbiosum]
MTMYDLSQNGYTDKQIKKLLKENRQISFECDLLNSQEKYVKTLHSIKGNVSFDAGAEIMGTASFAIAEEEVKGINLVDARLSAYMLLLSSCRMATISAWRLHYDITADFFIRRPYNI